MASLHRDVLAMGRRNEGVFPDLPVLHDELKVVAVAEDLEFLQRMAINYQ